MVIVLHGDICLIILMIKKTQKKTYLKFGVISDIKCCLNCHSGFKVKPRFGITYVRS